MFAAVGVDVGGTFTDFVAFGSDGEITTWKRLSTPANPERAVIEGLPAEGAGRVVHGSTVATNALLERRGPRTALLVTRGFADILEIRRQVRPRIYELEPRRRPHVVARGDVIEVAERCGPGGAPVIPLTGEEVARAVAAARDSGAGSFALCLLYGHLSEHEARLALALREAGLEVSVSSEVMPEHREYERASTTAVDAFLRPTVRGYLERLAEQVPSLEVIHSAGGLGPAAQAARSPVSLVTSGPAGGVLGAVAVARAAGYEDVITFDMGGTSTDVSLCPGGQPLYRTATEIDGLAAQTPMIDIVTVGAGGGSIARLDPGGAVRVGPESAGADPGPACYGRGALPTVSDANAVAGRLRPEQRLAGTLTLQVERARAALEELGDPAGMARAVIEVVNANMARALRAVSLERGFDPARFTLVAFGGAGPLHACELAAEVGVGRVLVPRHPGVLSALGMITAPLVVERSLPVAGSEDGALGPLVDALIDRARAEAAASGWPEQDRQSARLEWAADVRYRGQGHELRVALGEPPGTPESIATAFHAAYEARFGYADHDGAVEVVNLRLRMTSVAPGLPFREEASRPGRAAGVPIDVEGAPASLYRRRDLRAGHVFSGPAAVTQDDATTFVPAGWRASVDGFGNLVLEAAP